MPPPAFREAPLAALLRRLYRVYRNQPLCPAHGLLKRAFGLAVARRQQITLRNGLRLEVDLDRIVQNTLFWLDGDVEPALEWVVRDLLPPGGTLVDCGANCGFVGLLARRLRLARVLFVEPHPRLAATIRRNLELNGWSEEARVFEAAASDTEGEVVLHESTRFDGSHSILPDWVEDEPAGGREIRVPTRTLRSILDTTPGFERVDVLKIDTEGHDVAVLRGLGDRLDPGHITAVYVEMARDREEGFRLLESAGYTGFAARSLRRRHLNRLRRGQARGEPVAYFQPRTPELPPEAETLWVPRGGVLASFLTELTRRASIHP